MKPGNRVEDKTLATGKEQTEWSFMAENPPLATVNTHLTLKGRFRTDSGATGASPESGKTWTRDDSDAAHEPKQS